MRGFYIRGPFAVIARLDAAVAFFATALAHLGDTSSQDDRRVKAVLILTNPAHALRLLQDYRAWITSQPADRPDQPAERPEVDWSQFLPAVTVYVHLYGGPAGPDSADGSGLARIEGIGPVTEAWVREHLGPHARFTIRPVIDIEGQAPVDAYEIPGRHRQAVHLMGPANTFPYATNTSRGLQVDHTTAYRHGPVAKGAGQSRIGNYGELTVLHHRIKTFTGWQVQQPFPDIYLWRDPYGAHYLVDHTGTCRLGQHDQAA
jgi:hypothetical protein